MSSIIDYYRAINRSFLDNKSWQEGSKIGFELFYKTQNGEEEPKFLKFADYAPNTKNKIWEVLETEGHECLYIHENDLINYYEKTLIAPLKRNLDNGEDYKIILSNAYQIARMILQEYFENISSTRILRSLNPVVEIMTFCFTQGKMEIGDIFHITSKDRSHHSHCANAGLFNMLFAVKLGLFYEEVLEYGRGGLLYDIGKKSIPPEILEKTGELSPEEWQFIRKHPSAGRKVLNDMKCYHANILKMAGEHHEKYDGSGYPFGLAGEKISFPARVTAISDVFNAMVSERCYHKPRTAFEALVEMKDKMPGHFDPKMLVSFIKAFASSK